MKVKNTREYKLTLFNEMLHQKNSDQGDIAGLSANIRRFGSVREYEVIITLLGGRKMLILSDAEMYVRLISILTLVFSLV